MSITYKYGNGKLIGHRAVDKFHGGLSFKFPPNGGDTFDRLIDKGLILEIKTQYGEQTITLKRSEYRVVPELWNCTTLIFESNELARSLHLALDVEGFLHVSTHSTVSLASELASTITHQLATPFMKRKQIDVYLRSEPHVIAHSILRCIGLNRFVPGMDVKTFYQQHTPEAAYSALCAWLSNKDLRVNFLPHDGTKRAAFVSRIGENVLEFAEQA